MGEVTVRVPVEMESEFARLPSAELSVLVNGALRERLGRASRFKRLVSKSKMGQAEADKIADEISASLWKKYSRLSGKK